MKKVSMFVALAASLLLAGCAKKMTSESVTQEAFDLSCEMAKAISTVKDEASAKDAGNKVEKIVKEMEVLAKQIGQLKPLTETQVEAFIKKNDKKVNALAQDLSKFMSTAMNPGNQAFMKKLNERISSLDKEESLKKFNEFMKPLEKPMNEKMKPAMEKAMKEAMGNMFK